MPDQFMTQFEARRTAVEELLAMDPKDTKRFIALAINEVNKFPACTIESKIQCIIDAASCCLELGTPDHLAFLIPYKNQLTFQVSYTGMIRRAIEAKAAVSIYAELVYQNDTDGRGLDVISGSRRELVHRPKLFGDRGPLVGAFAVAVISRADKDFEIMEMRDIQAIKAAALRIQGSRGPSPAWKQFEGEMIKKSAIRRLCKRLQGNREHASAQALQQYDRARDMDNAQFPFEGQQQASPNPSPLAGVAEDIPDDEPLPEPEEERYLDLAEQDAVTSLIVQSGWPVRSISEILKVTAGVEASDQIKITDLPKVMEAIQKLAKERRK